VRSEAPCYIYGLTESSKSHQAFRKMREAVINRAVPRPRKSSLTWDFSLKSLVRPRLSSLLQGRGHWFESSSAHHSVHKANQGQKDERPNGRA
jgi:hypothetical protein